MVDFDAIWFDRPDLGTAAHSRWHRYADQRIRRGIGIDYAVARYEGGVRGLDGVAGGDHIIHKPDGHPVQWATAPLEVMLLHGESEQALPAENT